ncbi:ejaculatory bulb-specific protein 3-like [Chelonus insularis]|uniref:ejaculatory bulb-specific protein 3-like n=1 Tax=Chelonus insularis TaxID=460826 RepID=UPI0015883C8A|nr:ejaculatory bulb-specific protein 3-like [Chelonus insularis]
MALLIKVFLICISVYAVLSQNTGRHSLVQEVEALYKNNRLMERFLKCVVGEAPCDPQGKRLKALAPQILRDQCIQCTPQEKMNIKKILSYIQRYYPAYWAKIIRIHASH